MERPLWLQTASISDQTLYKRLRQWRFKSADEKWISERQFNFLIKYDGHRSTIPRKKQHVFPRSVYLCSMVLSSEAYHWSGKILFSIAVPSIAAKWELEQGLEWASPAGWNSGKNMFNSCECVVYASILKNLDLCLTNLNELGSWSWIGQFRPGLPGRFRRCLIGLCLRQCSRTKDTRFSAWWSQMPGVKARISTMSKVFLQITNSPSLRSRSSKSVFTQSRCGDRKWERSFFGITLADQRFKAQDDLHKPFHPCRIIKITKVWLLSLPPSVLLTIFRKLERANWYNRWPKWGD